MPDFIDHDDRRVVDRLLPPGTHKLTEEEVEEAFVKPFPTSLRRRRVFRNWTAFRAQIRSLVPVEQEYVDGSFVTDRPNPDDVDVSLWIRARDLEALNPGPQRALHHLIVNSKHFDCDAYIVPVCTSGDAMYQEFLRHSQWTADYWSSYRDPRKIVIAGVEKGYVEVVEA